MRSRAAGIQLLFSQLGYSEDIGAARLRDLLPFRPAAVIFSGVVRDDGRGPSSGRSTCRSSRCGATCPNRSTCWSNRPAIAGGRADRRAHRRPGLSRRSPMSGSRDMRAIRGFPGSLKALRQHGLKIAPDACRSSGRPDHGQRALRAFERSPPPAAGLRRDHFRRRCRWPPGRSVAGPGTGHCTSRDRSRSPAMAIMFFAAHTAARPDLVHTRPYNVGRIAGRAAPRRGSRAGVAERGGRDAADPRAARQHARK